MSHVLMSWKKYPNPNFPAKRVAPKIWWKLLISLVLLICIIGLSIFAILFLRQIPDADKPLEQKTAAEKEPAIDTQAGQQGPETDTEPEKAIPEKLMLQVTAVEDSWLKVIIDEKGATEYNLKSRRSN